MSDVLTLEGLPAGLRNAVVREVQSRVDGEHAAAVQEQALVARANGEHRSMDGLGRPRLSVHPTSYHYWGQRLGYQCWQDPQFLAEFERDNPACRVKSSGTRIQTGFTGEKRSSKTYAWPHPTSAS